MKKLVASFVLVLSMLGCVKQASDTHSTLAPTPLERGRYLVQIAGCNDCHTPNYMERAGKVDEKLWLTGDSIGWQGPWGTTYAPNLRMHMQTLTEDQWLKEARTREMRPPMPWYLLRVATDDDLRAIYQFIHSLSPVGEQSPAYLPPGVDAPLPKVQFVLPPGPPPAPAG